MSKFILNLNSRYRNPFEETSVGPTAFEMIMNPVQSNNLPQGANTSYTMQNPVYTAFTWPGPFQKTNNVTFPVNEIWTTWCAYQNNAVYGRSAKYNNSYTIILNALDQSFNVDYYVGCILMLFPPALVTSSTVSVPSSFETAIVSAYNPANNSVILQTGFGDTFLTTVYPTSFDSTYSNYYIINPTGTSKFQRPISLAPPCASSSTQIIRGFPFNLVILGLNSFLNAATFNYYSALALSISPTSALYVQNISKNWVTTIRYLDTYTRTAILDPVASPNGELNWGINDLYQLRLNNNIFTVVTTGTSYGGVPLQADLVNAGLGYSDKTIYPLAVFQEGVAVATTLTVLIVASDRKTGKIFDWKWANRGDGTGVSVTNGSTLEIVNASTSVPAFLRVTSVSGIGVPISVQDGFRTLDLAATQKFFLYAPLQVVDFYLSVAKYTGVYFSYNDPLYPTVPTSCYLDLCEYIYTTTTMIPAGTWIECMVYTPQLIGIQMTSVGFQQGVCYKIRLMSLAIPNQQVKGINELPSFFPYLLLELYNTSVISQSTNILYSNNPNTSRCAFVCHIGNPRNQLISNYIVIRTTQYNIVKWSSIGYLHFRILLPNGDPLIFNQTELTEYKVNTYKQAGKTYHGFIITMVNQITEPEVVATFEFELSR